MKARNIMLCCGLMAGLLAMGADVLSPRPSGYLERARLMAADANLLGVADQSAYALARLPRFSADAADALLLQARAALLTGDAGEASALLERFAADFPASPRRWEARILEADIVFNDDEYARALTMYDAVPDRCLADDARDDLRFRRAYCRLMLGDFQRARQGFDSLGRSPRYAAAAAFYNACISYARHEWNDALERFSRVDAAQPPADAAPYYVMEVLFVKGRYAEALDTARALIARPVVEAFTPEANRIAGESLYNMGRNAEATPYLWRYTATADDPAPSAYYILGYTEYTDGNWDNAVMLLQRAIAGSRRSAPDNAEDGAMVQSAYLMLGQAYLQRGDNDSALLAFEQAYRLNYDRSVQESALYNYAVARTAGGRVPFGSSVALMEDFLSEFPASRFAPKVREYVVNGYMTDNDYAAALAAIERDPKPSRSVMEARQRVLFELGMRECQAGRYAAAEQHLKEAIAMGKGYDDSILSQSRQWLGYCLLERGDCKAAAAQLEQYLDQTRGDDADPYNRMLASYSLGYARYGAGQWRPALDAFRTAARGARLHGDTELRADIQNRIGDCLLSAHDFNGAAKAYAEAGDIRPEAGDYPLYQGAIAQGLLGRHKAKIEDLDLLLSRFPDSGLAPDALLQKAESQLSLGDNNAAIATYRRLTQSYPATAPGRNGWLQLAMTCMGAGRRADAESAYREVIKRYPTSEEARLATDDLKRLYAAEGRLPELTAFLADVADAPRLETSDLEAAAFEAAENAYATRGSTTLLEAYLRDWPDGERRPQALYLMAENAWNEGKASQAIAHATRVVSEYPHSAAAESALLIRGEAELSIGKHEAALASFASLEEKASSADTKRQARLGTLRACMALKRHDDAIAAADRLLGSTAASAESADEVRYLRAVALDRRGSHAEADRELSALAANPTRLYGSMAAVALAENLLARGETSRAFTAADRFISANPPHSYWLARGFIVYSDILRRQGKTFEADEYLKSLRRNYPGSEADIRQMIDERISRK